MKYTLKISVGILLALTAFSCHHAPVIPDEPHVSYATSVRPIIAGNCMNTGCHDGVNVFAIDTYEELMQDSRIVPWKPYQSAVYTTIISQQRNTMMPVPPQHPLTEEQISTIYLWIEKGAPNN